MSNSTAVHLRNTLAQAGTPAWFDARRLRGTAANISALKTRPVSWTEDKLYKDHVDLSNVPAVKYGIDNEDNALNDLAQQYGHTLTKCGLFVHRQYPFLAASPDALIIKNNEVVVVEVKCAYVLRDHKPTDTEKLDKVQKRNFHSVKQKDGKLKLKPRHKYMYQVMHQMFVVGAKKALFVV